MKRYLLIWIVAMPLLLVLMPAALVSLYSPKAEAGKESVAEAVTVSLAAPPAELQIKVYRTEKKVVETLPLEQYIEGVVAAEMPAEFELEALKAQAMAARTYIARRLREGKFEDVPEGAHVLDTIEHQVYMDDRQRRERWGEQYEWKNRRIRQAVQDTAGIILTYNGEPIDATFFSTSNGFTENASEYWEKPIPYLKSVPSPWDMESPRYEQTVAFPVAEVERKLGVKLDQQAVSSGGAWYRVDAMTTGNRIGRITIGGKEFTGREVREKLNLNSSSFSMELRGDQIWITTKGYGHGVGMSQWGANGMAKMGRKAEQIVKYFYQGIDLAPISQVIFL